MSTVYAYPRLSNGDFLLYRVGGNGLGNLLFTWARCLADCHRYRWRMIWPIWPSCKPKNLWKNPYDLRGYNNLFSGIDDGLHGVQRLVALLLMKRIKEGDPVPSGGRCVVEYRGMKRFFSPFLDSQQLIASRLWTMTRRQHRPVRLFNDRKYVAVHIRCGDFRIPREGQISDRNNTRLPIAWYVEAIRQVRRQLAYDIPVVVFSDGRESEIRDVLQMPHVTRKNQGSAIYDIWALSQADLIIASGSTFSMWGVFLGQMPSLWAPGKGLNQMHVGGMQWQVQWSHGMQIPQFVLEGLTHGS